MYDGIFFVNNALRVNQLSVYSNEERFAQTLQTFDSIDHHCPNNLKLMFDSSPDLPDENYLKELHDRGIIIFYSGDLPDIQTYSRSGARSIAECLSFIHFMRWFKEQGFQSKRIYKLSGRYRLNENFILNDERYQNAFVFAEALDSWLPDNVQKHFGVNKLYRLRCWHMDYSLIDTFTETLPLILNDCATLGIDVEHSYYKNLHTYKTVELNKIGVCGNIAPSGDYIDE